MGLCKVLARPKPGPLHIRRIHCDTANRGSVYSRVLPWQKTGRSRLGANRNRGARDDCCTAIRYCPLALNYHALHTNLTWVHGYLQWCRARLVLQWRRLDEGSMDPTCSSDPHGSRTRARNVAPNVQYGWIGGPVQ